MNNDQGVPSEGDPKERLDVSLGCEGRTIVKESCYLSEVGTTVQRMIDDLVSKGGYFDAVDVVWSYDEDEVPEDFNEPLELENA